MNAIHTLLRPVWSFDFSAAIPRLALAGICLALAACGGSANPPPPPESVPVVLTQPADASAVVGSAASFSVAAAGTDPLAYQWASSSGGTTFTAIAGATHSSYSTGATALTQSGSFYRVVVSNSMGSVTSSAARLTVTPVVVAPAITLQPADVSVVAPATASFTAAATGVPLPTVQWQQSTDAGATWANLTVATGLGYTTPATVLADSGKRFRAVFNSASGSVNSNGAELTVTAPPLPPPSAAFNTPHGVAVDPAGNLYVADTGNHTIRKITPAGVVTTLAGQAGIAGSADGTGSAARFNVPRGLAVDAAGNVYVADTSNETIRLVTPAGVVSTLAGLANTGGSADGTGSAARFSGPSGVAVDAAGNVYVADTFNQTIRKITPGGSVSTLAGLAGIAGSVDGTGSEARFATPRRVAADAAGTVYVVELNHTVRKITAGGAVSTLAGLAGVTGNTDGTGSAARFADPQGVAVDAAGNVYVGDTANRTIRKVTPAGVVTTLAGLAGSAGNADGTGSAARFARPRGVAVDAAGIVYVADTDNASIRKITPAGVVTTIAQ